MLHEPTTERGRELVGAIVDELLRRGRVLHLIHLTGRLVRNLAVYELIIGGDCWDRGPRGGPGHGLPPAAAQRLVHLGQPRRGVARACLGQEALICSVLRVSLRYRRLSQIDEGYSIPLTPLEHLAATVYKDDPATLFMPKIGRGGAARRSCRPTPPPPRGR